MLNGMMKQKPVIVLKGAGPGNRISREEGLRRLKELKQYIPLHEWAGPLASSSEILVRCGIDESTLQIWENDRSIVRLAVSESESVYPLDQFAEGRPISGLAEIQQIIRDPRLAWRWLMTEKPESMKARPLDLLKRGRRDEVIISAQRDFD